MAWSHQATSNYLSQCWPRSMSPYDIPRPQKVNVLQFHLNDDFSTLRANNEEKILMRVPSSCALIPRYILWLVGAATLWTPWGLNKMVDMLQTTFSNAFSWMIHVAFCFIFPWSLFCRVQLMISQHWFSTYFFNPKPFPEFILCASPSIKGLIVTS